MQRLRIGPVLAVAGLLSFAACSGSGSSSQKDGPIVEDAPAHDVLVVRDLPAPDLPMTPDVVVTPDGPPVCLGSIYPNAKVIDPDNPDFSDALHTKAEVIAKFKAAKAANVPAYKAYKAALAYAAELECAFCDCGCKPLSQHKSAVDCFKDMHGFG